jgi:hypothetical protein
VHWQWLLQWQCRRQFRLDESYQTSSQKMECG